MHIVSFTISDTGIVVVSTAVGLIAALLFNFGVWMGRRTPKQ